MQFRRLGHSGLSVSAVGLGCNNLGGRIDDAASTSVVHHALDQGITLFDVADVYGRRDAHAGASEEALGRALGPRRRDIVLATKFGMKMSAGDDPDGRTSGASRRYIVSAVEASLKRLGTDWIDLYQLHAPDPLTPLEETLRALDDLTRAGKIRYAGVSNLPGWQVADAWHIAQRRDYAGIVSCQDELSLISRDALDDLVPALRHFGLGLLPYFPLASGMLTGKYHRHQPPPEGSRLAAWSYLHTRYDNDATWTLLEALRKVADDFDRSLTELAFGWLLDIDVVGSVIAGATTARQVTDNVRAAERPLDDAERQAVADVLAAHGGKPRA
ncbi:putative oxidoreductase [Neoasaia chiangmaiensis NBRC 101099]|uniref:Aldo/keto reductase n=1 Tax=Neoasaia chiangmaiensis TaxID=320497 RepID=A0A1U9KR72_9PROT|nr:aldo/keto reductase [Neoasaia chiangmaiensis]AQS88328.1 aldo/keto reductase [Neoasaia chiangmaiensis]GBR39529.1 putative oxidoreductase [Neoasaia chiangmaiensis NBRC 101099]GEN14624.1 oxidoreductase [Neoasaia chiangmaiensis]